MTPERWRQITRIFHEARLHAPAEREALLADACRSDPALRSDVEAMLAGDENAGTFGEAPALALKPGDRFGEFEIVSLLGVGGMGEVYRARDRRLGREVAIKILHAAPLADPVWLDRLEREARTLAALNHPNIATIYGIERADGIPALVLELVDGPTLADRIEVGPIPPDEALSIARQIVEALEAAHERGIIHRDIKPSNIKITRDGVVKVLDFGLAKAAIDENLTSRPRTATREGVIVGTPAYMSPEQARGQAVDRRTDIWAFGCVLFELLTGRRAFRGDHVVEAVASTLKDDPEWHLLPPETPPEIQLLLKGCLEKEPRRRVSGMDTARFLLTDRHSEHVEAGTASGPKPIGRRAPWRGLIIAGAALAASATTATTMWLTRPATPSRITRLTVTSSGAAAVALNGADRDLAISPDGRRVAYVAGPPGQPQLFIRFLNQLEPKVLVAGPSAPRGVFFSPDGEWIGFFDSTTTLKKVAVTGGPPITICRVTNNPRGAAWAHDGTIIFATSDPETGLLRVSADGGDVTVLTRPDRARGEGDYVFPELIPGTANVLFTIIAADGMLQNAHVAVFDLQRHTQKVILSGGFHARYSSSGHLLFAASNTLRAIRFDVKRLSVTGEAVTVIPRMVTTGWGAGDFDLSSDGTLAYVLGGAGAQARTLVWVDRRGREQPITGLPPRPYVSARVSPDGTRVALDIRDQESDIWVWDLRRETLKRLTSDPALDRVPVWTPDDHIIFSSARANPLGNLYRQSAYGIENPERLTDNSHFQVPSAVSKDGAELVFTETRGTRDVMLMTVGREQHVRPLVSTPFNDQNGVISPDGRWLAYESDESGPFEIYVRPYPQVDGGLWTVSTGGGREAAWAPDGRELFYVSPLGALMSVVVDGGATWKTGAPAKLIEGQYFFGSPTGLFNRAYDVSPDGKRFLMIKSADGVSPGSQPEIVVVQHWVDELQALVPPVR